MIVSNIEGTTRDATDTLIENSHGTFVFIETAGLRRKSRVDDTIEKYSVLRARMAVERASVCVLSLIHISILCSQLWDYCRLRSAARISKRLWQARRMPKKL